MVSLLKMFHDIFGTRFHLKGLSKLTTKERHTKVSSEVLFDINYLDVFDVITYFFKFHV